MLDIAEYNRRIDKLDKTIPYIYLLDQKSKLLKILTDLERQYDASQATRPDQQTLSFCIGQFKEAMEEYNRNESLIKLRKSIQQVLEVYRNELVYLRDNLSAQTSSNMGQQKDFLSTTSLDLTKQVVQSSPAPQSLRAEPVSEKKAEVGATQVQRQEDRKSTYEETNTLLEETKALLTKAQTDFARRLANLQQLLNDEVAKSESVQKATRSDLDKQQQYVNDLKKQLEFTTSALEEKKQICRILESRSADLKNEVQRLAVENHQLEARYANLKQEVDENSARVAHIAATYAEVHTHWMEMAHLLKLHFGAEQGRQSIQGGVASCSASLRRFLEKFVVATEPVIPAQSELPPSPDVLKEQHAP